MVTTRQLIDCRLKRSEEEPRLWYALNETVGFDAPRWWAAELDNPSCELHLELGIRDSRLTCMAYMVCSTPSGPPISSNLLKALPVVAAIQHACNTDGFAGLYSRRNQDTFERVGTDDVVKGLDELEGVSVLYKLALFVGENPSQFVARELSIGPSAAAKRVQRARAAGWLDPTVKGRKGA